MRQESKLLDIVIEPIKEYLIDTTIREIMVNHSGKIIIEKSNQLHETSQYLSPDQVETIIHIIANDNGMSINSETPSFSLKIEGVECCFQGLLPPVSVSPIFCIRKQPINYLSLNNLIKNGMVNKFQAAMLRKFILNKKTVITHEEI